MTRLRVVQFNMQFAQGWDQADPDHAPIDLDKTIREITSHNADIIFLQEVEQAQPNGFQVVPPPNYTRLQAALPGYDSCFTYPRADPRELPFGIGLAIFSRTPLLNVDRRDIPSPPVEFNFYGKITTPTDRVLLSASTIIGGLELRLIDTHLLAFFMLGTTSEAHPEQREMLAQILARAPGPMLLAADFNVRRHESLISQFARCGFRSAQDREVTWRRMPFVLDHIFYNDPLRCVGHRVVPTLASDHHVLVADFEWS